MLWSSKLVEEKKQQSLDFLFWVLKLLIKTFWITFSRVFPIIRENHVYFITGCTVVMLQQLSHAVKNLVNADCWTHSFIPGLEWKFSVLLRHFKSIWLLKAIWAPDNVWCIKNQELQDSCILNLNSISLKISVCVKKYLLTSVKISHTSE